MRARLLVVLCLAFATHCMGQDRPSAFDIARKGSVEDVRKLLETDSRAFLVTNEEGFSPLTLACYKSNNDVAKLLVDTGSDIDQTSKMGTPLMAAVVKGNKELVQYLLQKNAKVDLTDENGTTALMYATMFKNKEIVQLLLQRKADRSLKDYKGKTAFEYAVFSGDKEIINLLKN